MQRAAGIRAAWHIDAQNFDRNTANPALRAILSEASWVDTAFQQQLVGMRRALERLPHEAMQEAYGWTLHREAYDYILEPVHQYALLGILRGLWVTCPEGEQSPTAFADMAVRQPSGVLLSADRAEPVARIGKHSEMGWIYIPFAWDDLLQLSFEALFTVAGVAADSSLEQACQTLAGRDPSQADWRAAHPIWNGLCAKTILGRLQVAHDQEHARIDDLCAKAPVLASYRMHQRGVRGQDLGNSLTHVARIYTIAHEATHNLRARQRIAFQHEDDGAEHDADRMALMALWNHGMPMQSEVREGQSLNALWLASGIGFYLGLLAAGNLQRCVDEVQPGAPTEEHEAEDHGRKLKRLRAWVALASDMCDRAFEHGDADPHREFRALLPLVRWVVYYANALLDYGRQVVPLALHQASLELPPRDTA